MLVLLWAGVTGALNYDLLKTSTPAIPTTCTCSLVIGTSSTTYNDTGGSLSSYSYIPTSVANGSIILDNVDYSLARLLINKPVNVTNYSGIPPASLGNKYNVYLVKEDLLVEGIVLLVVVVIPLHFV